MLKYQRLVVCFEFFNLDATSNDEFRIMVVLCPKHSLGALFLGYMGLLLKLMISMQGFAEFWIIVHQR